MSPLAFRVLLVAAAVSVIAPAASPQSSLEKPPASVETSGEPTNDEIIRELIEKLGSDSYATRVRARNRLKRFGLEAFDALREAQDHSDSEILSAARYLISSLQVSWSKETDPKEVREILLEYGAQTDSERLARIELLGRLPGRTGTEALARLARFEPSIPLSRHAALLVLKQPIEGDPASVRRQAERIAAVVDGNRRDAAQWLQAYCSDLRENRYNEQRWRALVRQQRRVVDSGSSSNVTAVSVLELVRVLATRALAEGNREAALTLAQDHVDLVSADSSDLADHCQWAIQRGLFPVVTALYERNLFPFGRNAGLLYSVAQAFDETGQPQKAQQLAVAAFELNPFPPRKPKEEDEEPAPIDRKVMEIGDAHRDVAQLLLSRGRFDWAERELMSVIDHCNIESTTGVNAKFELAATYGEQLRHEDVINTLFDVVDRCEKDAQYRERLRSQLFPINRTIGLYHFAEGYLASDDGRTSEAKALFLKAYRIDQENIDILIKMYRMKDPDPNWLTEVRALIAQDREQREQAIVRAEAHLKQSPESRWAPQLAKELNQYAWLVANTEGDFEKALRWSLRSIELTDEAYPEYRSARMDTCARCYFALGRTNEAIATQLQALELTPHSPSMLRQLAEFEAAQTD